jgi:hypothetical protein
MAIPNNTYYLHLNYKIKNDSKVKKENIEYDLGMSFIEYDYSTTMEKGYIARQMSSLPVTLNSTATIGISFENIVYWKLITIKPMGFIDAFFGSYR